jgi:plasmid replication initiation protein
VTLVLSWHLITHSDGWVLVHITTIIGYYVTSLLTRHDIGVTLLAMDNLKVHKHNDLIQAKYSVMTMPEQLLLLAVIGKSDPREITAETLIEVTVSDFQDLLNSSRKDSYGELKKAVKRLYNRSVVIDNPDPENPRLSSTETRWVSSINYFDGEGLIQLNLAPKILPYLANLKDNYTSFFVRHVASFKSSYGVRLYELLIQWQGKGSREIDIDWLRDQWQLQDKYQAMNDFKKRVIDPAMKDINDHSNLWVKFGQRKRGRKVVAFQFEFGLKDDVSTSKSLTKKQADALAKVGESYPQLYARLKKEGYRIKK